jgi:hypothetical protein
MHALRPLRLQQASFFMLALWAAGMVAAGCGRNTADPGTTTADQNSAGDSSADDGSSTDPGVLKVTLCHIPPGNPANAHTITVGAPAVGAHLAHGDYLGPCHGSDGGSSNPGGGPPGPDDAGTPNPTPTCAEQGSSCGPGLPACCTGLICPMGQCTPRLN